MQIRIDEPHPGQQRVMDGAGRFNVLECGRRFGKTKLGILLASVAAVGGGPVGWFAPTYKFLPEVWAEAERTLRPLSPRVRVQERRIELPAGGVWEFWSLDEPNAGRGRKYQRVVLDEAGIVRGLMAAWQEAIRPTLADLRGDAWFLGTPKGHNDFHRLFAKGEQGENGWRSFRLPTVANPYISPAEVEAARRDMPDAAFRQEFLGVPADDGGNPFGLSALRACHGPLSAAPPAAWGVDLAKSMDWAVALALDAEGRTCRLERWQSDWGQTRRRLVDLIGDAPALVDSTGVGDPIVEDLQSALPSVEGFKFTAPSKQQLMEGLAAAVQRGEVRFPGGGWLASELESFEYEYRAGGGGVRYSAPPGMHDDGVCALALAVDKWQRDGRTRVGFNRDFYVLTAND